MHVQKLRRLCLVIPSLQVGGMERVMSELAAYFCSKSSLEVHLIVYGRQPEIFYAVPENLIIHKPRFQFNDSLRLLSTFRRLLYVRKKVKSIHPDSILSFGEYWNSFVLLALYGLKYPVYISDRCSPEKEFGYLHHLLRKVLYPKAKGIIAQTEKAKSIYSSTIKCSNICVIGNPIRKIGKEDNKEYRENILLTVGRLIETKHHDQLIKMFSEISYPAWKLVIIGDDALKQQNRFRLEQLILKLNLEERVILAGKRSDVEDFYLKSKIFVFASSSEGFPNVIGEAMSAGLPIVAFDCIAGPSDMVEDGENGFLIPLLDFKMFRGKTELLMKDEELRQKFGRNAQMSVRKFSIHNISKEYYNFLFDNARTHDAS